MNQQNLPMEFKQFLIADDGYLLVELDKAQAEWIVVAYYSGDARMIEVIEKDLDPHTRTGHFITDVSMELIEEENEIIGHETNPDIIEEMRQDQIHEIIDLRGRGLFIPRTMSIRQCGKKSNHGLNYGMGYKRFAFEYDVSESESKTITNRYHQAYPGIKGSYHSGIQYLLSKNNRIIENCFGRKRQFLKAWNFQLFNQAYDYIAQSTVADLVNRSLTKIYHDPDLFMDKIEFLAQVHDSILFQYPIKDLQDFARAVFRCRDHLNPTMHYSGRDFTIKTDMKIGLNWRDMKGIEIGSSIDRLAKRISTIHRGL